MPSRALLACSILSVVAAVGVIAAEDQIIEPPAFGTNLGVNLDLKGELQKGLKARRPVEFKYINELVALVALGEVPESLVTSTFIWARKKPTRQLQYFQFALKTRGDQLGIRTPELGDQFVNPYTGTLMP